MAAGDQYTANTTALQSSSSNLTGLAGQSGSVVSDLSSLVIDVLSFAQIGSSVGAANSSLQSSLSQALSKVTALLKDIGSLVGVSAQGYSAADQAVAQSLGAGATTGTPAAATDPIQSLIAGHHQGDKGADVLALQQKLTAAGYNTDGTDGVWGKHTQDAVAAYQHDHPTAGATGGAGAATAPGQLDNRVVDSIMHSEGTGGEQGGRAEAYGFRQGNGSAYTDIMAARQQYGVGSPQEHAVVAQYMQQNAQAAGALNFTDPGVQAAVMSAAHMRGTGGAQAILNSVAGAPIQQTGTLSPQTISTIQNMTPQQFQTAFHDTRIDYDQQIYGGTTTHQGGVTDNWWHRYGTGLTNRYNQEQQQFLGLSGGN
ncbi:MAG: peptidoglycan-binding protein [Actinomycetota bacterium]|nr:peptidoglycan-binding protein [Actinomycetota bacterium]MDQ2959022.1 peptidoglycan-binding protein [Actinomycetota bacterium]